MYNSEEVVNLPFATNWAHTLDEGDKILKKLESFVTIYHVLYVIWTIHEEIYIKYCT